MKPLAILFSLIQILALVFNIVTGVHGAGSQLLVSGLYFCAVLAFTWRTALRPMLSKTAFAIISIVLALLPFAFHDVLMRWELRG
jgi:hypothetical protein